MVAHAHAHSSTTPSGKKTNSLAFSATDCHTCASNRDKCDRQRPRCSTCLDQGRTCGGFATPLSWDNKRTWLGKSSRQRGPEKQGRGFVEEGETGSSAFTVASNEGAATNGPRHFRFVLGKNKDRKRRKLAQPRGEQRPGIESTAGSVDELQLVNTNTTGERNTGDKTGERDIETSIHAVSPVLSDNIFDPSFVFSLNDDLDLPSPGDYLTSQVHTGPSAPCLEGIGLMEPGSIEPMGNSELSEMFADGFQLLPSDSNLADDVVSVLQPPLLTHPLGNQHEALLNMYDSEFCVLPITSDTALNPFRCREPLSQGSKLLFHSILALCCRHLSQLTGTWASEEREHRSQASNLLEYALQSDQLAKKGLTLLEPILILFTLDCTLSATGRWTTYLSRARSILEACGGPSSLNSGRLRCQVAMIIWWDATLALVSRQGTVFPRAYLEHLTKAEKHDRWSFYDLTGCPSDLVVQIFNLAELAQQNEIASTMAWLTFNNAPVDKIGSQLEKWTHPAFDAPDGSGRHHNDKQNHSTTDDDESAFNAQQDQHHCAEAWRYSLLLYIERTFKWDRSQPRPLSIPRLARLTLNQVRSCRRTSQAQKQLLLPVFLAGSETGDDEMRDLVRGYCKWWGERSRYNMFHSVPTLLEDIWGGSKWWGDVVDEKTRGVEGETSKVQFLFG